MARHFHIHIHDAFEEGKHPRGKGGKFGTGTRKPRTSGFKPGSVKSARGITLSNWHKGQEKPSKKVDNPREELSSHEVAYAKSLIAKHEASGEHAQAAKLKSKLGIK